jgi:signal peptidase I
MTMLDQTWKVGVVMGVAALIRVVLHFDRGLPKSFRASAAEFLDSALIALALVFFIIRPFVIQAFFIPSSSMEDTLQINDRILVSKFVYRFQAPERGDIVVFRSPLEASEYADCTHCEQGRQQKVPRDASGRPLPVFRCRYCGHKIEVQKDFIKRLMGLPGDRVRVHDGTLYINGIPYEEPYIRDKPNYEFPGPSTPTDIPGVEIVDGQVVVPQGKLFMLGDNRNNSNDGHAWGFVPRESVLGKALFVFWSNPEGTGRFPDLKRFGWGLLRSRPQPMAAPPEG